MHYKQFTFISNSYSQIKMTNITFVDANMTIQKNSKIQLESSNLRGGIDNNGGSILHASKSDVILHNVKFHDNDGTKNVSFIHRFTKNKYVFPSFVYIAILKNKHL